MGLPINVASMANGDNHDQEDSVIDGVENSVVGDPQPVTVSSAKQPRGRRARIFREESYRPVNARLLQAIAFAEFSECCWSKLNSVLVYDQPRSRLTCSHGMLAPASLRAASNATTSCDSSSASSIWSYCSGLTKTAARRP